MSSGNWGTPAWLAGATAWLDERLIESGRQRTGALSELRVRPWSVTFSAPTDRVVVWFKACAPATAFELDIYRVLTETVPEHILRPLAADPVRSWLLLPDGGEALGSLHDDPGPAAGDQATHLTEALVQYGALQRATAARVDELLAAGVADMRPGIMAARFDEAVEKVGRGLASGDREGRDQLAAVAAIRPLFRQWCAELAESPLPAALDHNDLHVANILGRTGSYRYYDWGDAVIAHPFACLLVPLGMIATLRGVTENDPQVLAARSRYLAGFDTQQPDQLERAADLAVRVAMVARALVWDRAIALQRESGETVDPD